MTDELKNALSDEEWAGLRMVREPGYSKHAVKTISVVRGNGPTHVYVGEEFTDQPHALAALCLWGTSEGFTHEDVEFIEEIGIGLPEGQAPYIRSLASRIRALLPPEKA